MQYNYLLPQSIERSAALFPERTAFRAGKKEIKYRDLLRNVNYLAHKLEDRGIKKGDRVGILMNRCLETSIAIYAIMQAGAVYVPLDNKAPIDRLTFLINDCSIRLVLSVNSQKRITQGLSIPHLEVLQVERRDIEKDIHYTRDSPLLEDDSAYIIYTSGSTGTPKGIVHTHRSGMAYARLTASTYEIDENDVIANHAPIFFDISTLGYFTGPLCGACTVLLSDAHTVMAASAVHLLAEEKISIWYSVPRAIIQMLETGMLEKRDFPSLRWMLYAGEAFPVKHLRRTMLELGNTKFSNIYGPTETNQCTHYIFEEVPEEGADIPIGLPWKNTEFLILESELLIRSATNMLAYWRNETLTYKAFHTITEEDGIPRTYYKTGDLVELREDGLLYLIGRRDHQVKVRGFRVELGEIERAFLQYKGVKEAVVSTRKEGDVHVELIAYIRESRAVESEDLMKFLKKTLPHYAVPTEIHTLEEMPRTANGKVDRKALSKMISN